jgi:quercetin dioxygenase-like cupin family protein
MSKPFRRIVTTHDEKGVSIVRSIDELSPSPIARGVANFQLVWTTSTVPADNNDDSDGGTAEAGLTLKGGSVIRIVDMLPGKSSPMHRSYSIDYGIILEGELEMELDGGEVVPLKAGDIVVQRGTNHLWRNPSPDRSCRIAFILLEAAPVVRQGRELPEVHP